MMTMCSLLSIILIGGCHASSNSSDHTPSSPPETNNSTHQASDKQVIPASDEQSSYAAASDAPTTSENITNHSPNTLDASQKSRAQQKSTEALTKPNPPISPEQAGDLLIQPSGQPTPTVSVHPSGGMRHMLEVNPQIQRAWNTCAPTTVSMMLSTQDIHISQEELATDMGTDQTFGTHNAEAIRVLNKHLFGYDSPAEGQAGYRLETVTSSDPQSEDMKRFKQRLVQNIKDGYPMYYTINNSKIYPDRSGEHNVIGIGYVTKPHSDDVAYVYFIDPSPSAQDPIYNGLKIVTPEQLLAATIPNVEPQYAW